MNINKRLKNSIDLLTNLKNYLKVGASSYFETKKALRTYLLKDNKYLNPEIVELVPPTELGGLEYKLLDLLNNPNHPPGNSIEVSERIDKIIQTLSVSKKATLTSDITIFYSWQSDTNHKTNRNYINKVLEQIRKELEAELKITITLDKDTKNISGSPDIINVIRKKIEKCDIFIGDVTPIISTDNKKIPNPNVMLELGYAWSQKGADRILMILNESYSSPRDLPFDLGFKRQIRYNYENTQIPLPIEALKGPLKSQIKSIILEIIDK